jgi:hypothetical protein
MRFFAFSIDGYGRDGKLILTRNKRAKNRLVTMKCPKLIHVFGLCLLAANLTQGAVTWNFDSGASGSGPYSIDTPVDPPIQDSSQLTPFLPVGVTASISSGATAPASGNYLLLSASSQAINSGTTVLFTINASGAVELYSLSYAAIVFMMNQGPDQITWSYTVNYGSGNIGPYGLTVDTFKNKGDWASYNPNFSIITTGAATITVVGALSGSSNFTSDNGSVGFDSFSFDVASIVPEPATMALLGFGLVFVFSSTRKLWWHCPGWRR